MCDTRIMVRKAVRVDAQSSLPRGTWASAIFKGRVLVNFSCPKCGTIQGLVDHQVKSSGDVQPDIICRNEDCAFQAWVRLGNWEG